MSTQKIKLISVTCSGDTHILESDDFVCMCGMYKKRWGGPNHPWTIQHIVDGEWKDVDPNEVDNTSRESKEEREKRRTPEEVVAKVLALLPETEGETRQVLLLLQRDVSFVPSDHEQIKWLMVNSVMKHLALPFPPKAEWEREVYRIVTKTEPPPG